MAKRGNPNAAEDGKKGGRPKGSKDKISRSMKERVIQTWDALEANNQSLEVCAKEDPQWFYVNFVKPMLPKDVDVDVNVAGGIRLITNVRE